MQDTRQYNLFGRKTRGWGLPPKLRNTKDRLLALARYAGKVTLHKKRIKEKAPLKIRYRGNKPLFYGLPTMERWLLWEQSRAKKHNPDTS